MFRVGDFIQKEFQVIGPYAGVNQIREQLIRHSAMVVLAEKTNDFLGIITPNDIAQRQHNLVIDCLTEKPILSRTCYIENALKKMRRHQAEVLPIANKKKFEGLVFKNDLVAHLSSQNARQNKQLKKSSLEIEKSEKILHAIYDSTHSIRFLIAPDHRILFFNKKANEKAISLTGKKLKIGDDIMPYMKNLFITHDSRFFKKNIKTAMQGEQVISENEIKNQQDSFWLKTEYYPVCSGIELIGVSVSIRDISKKKKSEIFVRQQNEAFKKIMFFHSHEVRRPVAHILGLISLMEKPQSLGDNEKIAQMLKEVGKDLNNITKKIIDKVHLWSANKRKGFDTKVMIKHEEKADKKSKE